MSRNRGLGVAKDSIFKKTVPVKSEKVVKEWVKYSTQIKEDHLDFLRDESYKNKKQKRDVLNDIIQFYIDKHQ